MRWQRVLGVAGCLTVLTFLCVGALAWGAWLRYGNETPVEQALPPTEPDVAEDAGGEPGVNRIALVGEEGNIWTVAPNGSDLKGITRDAAANTMAYRYPTWSPDAQRLAFVELAVDETNRRQSALHIVSADGAEDTRVATEFSPLLPQLEPHERGACLFEQLAAERHGAPDARCGAGGRADARGHGGATLLLFLASGRAAVAGPHRDRAARLFGPRAGRMRRSTCARGAFRPRTGAPMASGWPTSAWGRRAIMRSTSATRRARTSAPSRRRWGCSP